MEVLVLKSFMFGGKPVPAGTVIDMLPADAAYAVALRRADVIAAPPESTAESKPARARKARES